MSCPVADMALAIPNGTPLITLSVSTTPSVNALAILCAMYCPKKDFRRLREYSGALVSQDGGGSAILQTTMESLLVIPM